ncbi:hypothetical protein Q5752_001408 [Cryptotrichosporon argae]
MPDQPATAPLAHAHKTNGVTGTAESPEKSKKAGAAGAGAGGPGSGGGGGAAPQAKDVVSPGELCGFVDTLLTQLETRFDEMSEQVLSRMSEMSARIDGLETAISDLMHGGIEDVPARQ